MTKEKYDPACNSKAKEAFTTFVRQRHGRDIFADSIQSLILQLPRRKGIPPLAMEQLLRDLRNQHCIKLKTYKEDHDDFPAGLTRIRITQKGVKALNVRIRQANPE